MLVMAALLVSNVNQLADCCQVVLLCQILDWHHIGLVLVNGLVAMFRKPKWSPFASKDDASPVRPLFHKAA
jgi:uncharacterized membrane protein YdfJ with MMPL/SSD domain